MLFIPVEHSRGELMLQDPQIISAESMPPLKESKAWRKFRRKAMLRQRYVGFSTLTGSMATTFSWSASVSLTGSAYNPSNNTGSILKRQTFGTAAANAASGGCDECFSFQQGVTAGASVTLDLYAMTDLLQRTSVTIARIKGFQIRLLSATDDSTISPAPTATSYGCVTNMGIANPSPLNYNNGGSGLTLALTQTAGAITGVAIGAAGTLYPKSSVFTVAPVQNSGAGGLIYVTTNGSGVPTAVAIAAAGTGYSDATVPSVVAGQNYMYTGGAVCYFDPSATGFCLVSTTSKNIKLINTDASNAITYEIDVYAATS